MRNTGLTEQESAYCTWHWLLSGSQRLTACQPGRLSSLLRPASKALTAFQARMGLNRLRISCQSRMTSQPRPRSELVWAFFRGGPPIGLAMLAQTSPAFSHALLERANPPVGNEVAVSPPELSITFTEDVEPLFSTIEVNGPNGSPMATGKPHVALDSNRRLVLQLPRLVPGTYTVIWHVTSVDTHKTEGRYTFTVTR